MIMLRAWQIKVLFSQPRLLIEKLGNEYNNKEGRGIIAGATSLACLLYPVLGIAEENGNTILKNYRSLICIR